MKDYENSNNNISKIAMWGPSGSGKSWLIHAFGKTLLKYTLRDDDFLYEMTNRDGLPLDFYGLPNVQPTSSIEDQVFLFRRRGKKISNAHRISSHSHQISIIDNKGSNLLSLDDMATSTSLINSPNIILLLDTSLPQQTHFVDDASEIHHNNPIIFSPKEYKSVVAKLFQLLNGSMGTERRIAVCLTKVDLLRLSGRAPTELVKMFFGEELISIFMKYRSMPNLALEFFSVSSAGFIRDLSGTKKPNFDTTTGGLLNPQSWEPYNVEAPFFWFFENIEKKRILQGGSSFASKLFGGNRLKEYIPYPIRNF